MSVARQQRSSTSLGLFSTRRFSVVVFVVLLIGFIHNMELQKNWTDSKSKSFRTAKLAQVQEYQNYLLGGDGERERDAAGDLAICASIHEIGNDTRIAALAEEWRRRAVPLVEKLLQDSKDGMAGLSQQTPAAGTEVVTDFLVIEKYFGDLLRELWAKHGFAIFAHYLKHFHIEIRRESLREWNEDHKDRNGLGIEEHALGMWLGNEISSKIETYKSDRKSFHDLGFYDEVQMLCAISEAYAVEQVNSVAPPGTGTSKWEYAEESFKVFIGRIQNMYSKYDDIIHALVWSHLQFLRDRSDFGRAVTYIGKLCNLVSTNSAYMACGHGIGHGINFYSDPNGVPGERARSSFLNLDHGSVKSTVEAAMESLGRGNYYGDDGGEEPGQEINLTRDGEVRKRLVREGDGSRSGRPRAGDKVVTHYIGMFLNGTVFEASRDEGKPLDFRLGQGVIKGYSMGVETMKKGEICMLTIEPSYGYGSWGDPPNIPPDTTLVFQVELLDWESASQALDGNENYPQAKERNALSFDLLMFACEHSAYAMGISEEDEILFDYAASSCYTGFYHQLNSRVLAELGRELHDQAQGSGFHEKQYRDLGESIAFIASKRWNDKLLAECNFSSNIYLEALWSKYKHGKEIKLLNVFRRAAAACYFNKGYFQFAYDNHISEAYRVLNELLSSCTSVGKDRCNRMCENDKFQLDCVEECKQLALDNVQPLCWHGVGSMLGSLYYHCFNFEQNRRSSDIEKLPPEESKRLGAERDAMSKLGRSLCLCLSFSLQFISILMFEVF